MHDRGEENADEGDCRRSGRRYGGLKTPSQGGSSRHGGYSRREPAFQESVVHGVRARVAACRGELERHRVDGGASPLRDPIACASRRTLGEVRARNRTGGSRPPRPLRRGDRRRERVGDREHARLRSHAHRRVRQGESLAPGLPPGQRRDRRRGISRRSARGSFAPGKKRRGLARRPARAAKAAALSQSGRCARKGRSFARTRARSRVSIPRTSSRTVHRPAAGKIARSRRPSTGPSM